MKLQSDHFLKWLKPDQPPLKGGRFHLVNHCALIGWSPTRKLQGLTIFRPEKLTTDFIERLKARQATPEFASLDFELYLPPNLTSQWQFLKSKIQLKKFTVHFTPFLEFFDSNKGPGIRQKIRVLSVDDSPVMLKFLKKAMDQLSFVEVIDQVTDPLKAMEKIEQLNPDLLTFDIQMPGLNGVDLVKKVRQKHTTPIIMISGLSLDDGSLVFEALNSGAFDYIQKPEFEAITQFQTDLESKLLLAVDSVVPKPLTSERRSRPRPTTKPQSMSFTNDVIWCVGSSTGGTQALTEVFTNLPAHIPPTFIVQHIPPVFSKAFAESLDEMCPFTVKEAEDGDIVKPDHVYVAPGGTQMAITKGSGNLVIRINDDAPVNRFKPSVDYMFQTVAKLKNVRVVGCVLTGMGRDGAQGLLDLRNAGAMTFAQDEASSIVYGMPRAAYENGAAMKQVALDRIADELLLQTQTFQKAG
jgi:two-component system, chemotaxis family, protein-glutamate methylesterase/glutaminase